MRGRNHGDEELGTVGATTATLAGVCHSEQVRTIELELRVDLIVEHVARAAGAGAQRVTTLNHESGDDAVENGLIVERAGLGARGVLTLVLLRALCQADEVVDSVRRVVAEQVNHDIAMVGVHSCSSSLNSHVP